MPMTGVMPEPAVTKSSLPPSVREHELARRPARGGRACRAARRADEVGADQAVRDRLDGDRDAAVGARAVGQGVGPPLADAVDVDADADVLPGHVAGPVGAGADDDRGGVGGLGVDRHDAAAQVGAGAQRVEEVEVVGRQQRGGGALGQPGQPAAQRTGGRLGSRVRSGSCLQHD